MPNDETVRLYLLPGELARADAAGYIERDADGVMWSNVPNLPRVRVVRRELLPHA